MLLGSPRVFDSDCSKIYSNALGKNTIMIAQNEDPVQQMPPSCMSYDHVKKPFYCNIQNGIPILNSYYNAIKHETSKILKSNNSESIFNYPIRIINELHCSTLGKAHYAIAKLTKNYSSSKIENILSVKALYKPEVHYNI